MNTYQNKLVAEGISKSYSGKQVIQDININLKEGEVASILGRSGVGKSTLFHILSGILKPDSGRVVLDGEEITNKAGNISYMQQKDLLLPYKTIENNIALPLILHGKSKEKARLEIEKYVKEFGLEGTMKKYPSELSGGMKQRVALLRTFFFESEVMLLDEPFSSLDAVTKSEMHNWYKEVIQKFNKSTLFITHDIDEAIYLSNRIYVISGIPGKIVEQIKIEGNKDSEFLVSKQFIEYKKQILKVIN